MRPKRGRSLDIGVVAPSLGSKGQIKLSYRHPRAAWLAEAPRPYINGLVHTTRFHLLRRIQGTLLKFFPYLKPISKHGGNAG